MQQVLPAVRMAVNLERELRDAQRLARDPQLDDAIAALDIHMRPDAYGLEYVSINNGRYSPDNTGAPAFIVESVQFINGYFQLVDLVAATLDRQHTATRLGVARMVGWSSWYRARMRGERLIVHRDVLAWLNRGGVGVAVLDWRAMAGAFLDVPRIVVEDEGMAAFVHGVLSAFGRPPPIDVVIP